MADARKTIARIVASIAVYAILAVIIFYVPHMPFFHLGKSYSLNSASVVFKVNNDGTISAGEQINYSFKGCWHGVERDFNMPIGSSLSGPYMTDISAYCSPECNITRQASIVRGNFTEICNRDATFYLNYTVHRAIFKGDNFEAFHYQVWGKDWKVPLKQLHGKIILPVNVTSKEVYFNPQSRVQNHNVNGTIVSFDAYNLRGYAEARILLPRDTVPGQETSPSSLGTKREVVMQEQWYHIKYFSLLAALIALLAFLLYEGIVVPARIYQKFGKEPERIHEIPTYEREIPYGLKPYILNSLCISDTGSSTNDSVKSIILDLVRRKHIEISEEKRKGIFGKTKDALLKFTDNEKSDLDEIEKSVYDYFYSKSKNGELLWSEYSRRLSRPSEQKDLRKMIKKLNDDSKDELESMELFNFKGKRKMNVPIILLVSLPLAAIFLTRLADPNNYHYIDYVPILGFLFIILGLAYYILPSRVFGRFSEKGLDAYLKGRAMKKFFGSLTSLRRYPPSSVAIWDEQIVYAAALGEAATVSRYLKEHLPDEYRRTSALTTAMSINFAGSFDSAMARGSASGSAGGGGGVGGGAGGGGGGAF